MNENVRLVATIAVIIIFLSLSWVYKNSFKKNQNKKNDGLIGILIIVLCFLLAFYLM